MVSWIEIQAQADRRQDDLRAAERQLLVAAARIANPRRRLYSPALVMLGRRLADWGRDLQGRHGAIVKGAPARSSGW